MSATFGPDQAEVLVYTFKEGVLAAVGHDLKLRVRRFAITVDGDRIEGTFDAGSLQTVCARRSRADAPGVLSDSDARQVDENTRTAVLDASRYPSVKFATTRIDKDDPDEWEVTGQLSLHGVTRSVTGHAPKVGSRRIARFTLNQPDFGIKPFTALLGTLRVQPRVEVEISIPA